MRLAYVLAAASSVGACGANGETTDNATHPAASKDPGDVPVSPETVTVAELRKRGLRELDWKIHLMNASEGGRYASAVVVEGYYYGPNKSPWSEADRQWYCPVPSEVAHKNSWTDEEKSGWQCHRYRV